MAIAASCSVPNLETAGCAQARNAVKRFYSLHFANVQTQNAEYENSREELVTQRLRDSLPAEGTEDYFTKTADFPKAFRIGVCTQSADDRATLQVVLLWRDDIRNEQREVSVSAIRSGSGWLIDSVEN